MNLLTRIYKRLENGTFVDALKNQPSKYKRKQWEKIVNSGVKTFLFNHKNIFKINLPIDSELSQYIFQKNFENDEINFITKYLRKGDYFIDIGANIGFFSILASKKVGNNGKVYSFEPTAQTHNRLLDNIKLNNCTNIIPIKKAFSNQEGVLELNTSQDGFDAWNSFAMPVCGDIYVKEKVETITLNDFIKENNLFDKINLIKIDVEGWEKYVLDGGADYLKKDNAPDLLVEFVEAHTENAGYKCASMYKQLVSFGYSLYLYTDKHFTEQPLLETFQGFNFVVTKDIEKIKKLVK